MCGIVGYIGYRQATEICLAGLKRLEYRGYDSAGIAVVEDGRLEVVKVVGKLRALAEALEGAARGHARNRSTRWATHGKPSRSTPSACLKRWTYRPGAQWHHRELRPASRSAPERGLPVRFETDTEVIVHLVSKYYEGDLPAAFRRAVRPAGRIRGGHHLRRSSRPDGGGPPLLSAGRRHWRG